MLKEEKVDIDGLFYNFPGAVVDVIVW